MAAEFDEHDAVGIANAMQYTNALLPLGERLRDVSPPTLLTLGAHEDRFLPSSSRRGSSRPSRSSSCPPATR
jgi:hypothetical protein